MKAPVTCLILGLACHAYSQGWIYLDNVFNSDTSPTASRNGLFFLCQGNSAALINSDFNVSFYGGSTATSLTLLKSFVGAGAVNDNAGGPGTFIDQSGLTVSIAGVTNNGFLRIDAWVGSATSYDSAILRGTSGVFSNPLGNPFASPPDLPTDLSEMPAVIIGPIECPEPGAMSLACLGAMMVMLRISAIRRHVKKQLPGPTVPFNQPDAK
jgi:hypothetical protein